MPMLPHFIKGLQDIFTPSRPSSPNSRQLNITTTLTEHEVLKNLRMCDKKAKSALEELHAQHKVTDQSHIFKLSSEACDSFVNTDPNYEIEGFDPDFDDAVYNPMDQASSACLKDFENKTRVMHHQQSIQDTLIQAIQGDCNPLDASILTLMSDWDKMLDVSKLDSLHDIYIRFINYIGKDSLSYKSDLTQAIITGHNGAFQFLKGLIVSCQHYKTLNATKLIDKLGDLTDSLKLETEMVQTQQVETRKFLEDMAVQQNNFLRNFSGLTALIENFQVKQTAPNPVSRMYSKPPSTSSSHYKTENRRTKFDFSLSGKYHNNDLEIVVMDQKITSAVARSSRGALIRDIITYGFGNNFITDLLNKDPKYSYNILSEGDGFINKLKKQSGKEGKRDFVYSTLKAIPDGGAQWELIINTS